MKSPVLIAAAANAERLETPAAPLVLEAMERFSLTKDQAFTVVLGCLVREGLPSSKALDLVFGEGTFRALADDVWQLLQEKEQLPANPAA